MSPLKITDEEESLIWFIRANNISAKEAIRRIINDD